MIALKLFSTIFLGASAAMASPGYRSLTACSLLHAPVPVAPGMTAPTIAPSFLGLGVGVQNYTCNATSGTYVSVGAVAELFDISCFVATPKFDNITNVTFAAWADALSSLTTQKIIEMAGFSPLPILGQHYFIQGSTSGAVVPVWDFTSSGVTKGNVDAFVNAAKDLSVPSYRPAIDVPSLQLHGVNGKLATTILRLEDVSGQPPSTCSGSGSLSVKYTAFYYLFGFDA